MKEILVIQEDNTIIGVVSTKENALKMIQDYFGSDSFIFDIIDVRDSGIEFTCTVNVDYLTNDSYITVFDFTIDEI